MRPGVARAGGWRPPGGRDSGAGSAWGLVRRRCRVRKAGVLGSTHVSTACPSRWRWQALVRHEPVGDLEWDGVEERLARVRQGLVDSEKVVT